MSEGNTAKWLFRLCWDLLISIRVPPDVVVEFLFAPARRIVDVRLFENGRVAINKGDHTAIIMALGENAPALARQDPVAGWGRSISLQGFAEGLFGHQHHRR